MARAPKPGRASLLTYQQYPAVPPDRMDDPGTMDDGEIAAQRPATIDEALECMRTTLVEYVRRRDRRAIFLHVYYEMTLEVHDALGGRGDYAGQRVFLDPDWVRRLSGLFAGLYFSSTAPEPGEPGSAAEPGVPGRAREAWRIAYAAAERRGSVVLDALLGINAHINDDLAKAIAANLDPAELADPAALQLRKFDHDQVNNLLVRALGRIQDVLARHYDPGLRLADRFLGRLDERVSAVGLSYYRERVWWDALTYACATAADERSTGTAATDVVRDKLNWESAKVAKYLLRLRRLWAVEWLLGLPWRLGEERRWARIELPKPDTTRVTPPIRINPLR